VFNVCHALAIALAVTTVFIIGPEFYCHDLILKNRGAHFPAFLNTICFSRAFIKV
jgi:hypothetical protein